MAAPPGTVATATGNPAPPSPVVPWWAHLIIGAVVLAGGIALVIHGDSMLGDGIVIAAVAFLGVGSGVAAGAGP